MTTSTKKTTCECRAAVFEGVDFELCDYLPFNECRVLSESDGQDIWSLTDSFDHRCPPVKSHQASQSTSDKSSVGTAAPLGQGPHALVLAVRLQFLFGKGPYALFLAGYNRAQLCVHFGALCLGYVCTFKFSHCPDPTRRTNVLLMRARYAMMLNRVGKWRRNTTLNFLEVFIEKQNYNCLITCIWQIKKS